MRRVSLGVRRKSAAAAVVGVAGTGAWEKEAHADRKGCVDTHFAPLHTNTVDVREVSFRSSLGCT